MSQTHQLAERIWNLFAASKPALRVQYRSNNDITEKLPFFSPFQRAQAEKVNNLINHFNRIVENNKNEYEGLQQVLDEFTNLLNKEHPDLLYYALESYLTNYQGEVRFVIPSLMVREPELVIPSSSAGSTSQLEFAVGVPEESKMDWFREDPALNEHHSHWHSVYSNSRFRDRQGEMFFYMHQQMIARYDADRPASGVQPVKPFNNMLDQFINAGYAPGDDTRFAEIGGFGSRDARQMVQDEAQASKQVSDLENIQADILGGAYKPQHSQKPEEETRVVNLLGSTIEQNVQADFSKPYTNYHGDGHVVIGGLNNGVMLDPTTAMRDVIFWEWHKGVDDIYFTLQETFQPTDFSVNDPKVTLRKRVLPNDEPYSADLILCHTADIPGDPIATGTAAFGGDNWDKDFAEGTFTVNVGGDNVTIKTVNTLQTKMNLGTIHYNANGEERAYPYPYLLHEPFSYYLRVENKQLEARLLTIRIFMVPVQWIDNRRSWIELDKFTHTINGNTKEVIYRPDTMASVVKKPAQYDPLPENRDFDPTNIPVVAGQCICGWPYRMLLPKGTEEGMPFVLMAMITDGTVDGLGQERDCGSVSFCGTRSGAYPDKFPLGFPFNRPFEGNNVRQLLNGNKNVIARTIQIKHTPEPIV